MTPEIFLLKYFDLTIDNKGKVKLRFKEKFKKKIPSKKLKELNGPCLSYYQFHLGEEIGRKVFLERKKVFGKVKLSKFVLENNLYNSEEQKEKVLKGLEELLLKIKESVKGKTWTNQDYINKTLASRKKHWSDPINRESRRQKWLTSYWNTEKSEQHKLKLKTIKKFSLVDWQVENGVRHKKNLIEYRGKKVNDIEFLFCGLLNNFEFDYEIEPSFKFNNKNYFVDFFIPSENLIIEVFGDYWHANPKFFTKDKDIRGVLVEKIWNRDKKRKEVFEKHNFTYISFWELQIRKDTSYIIKFLRLLKEKQNEKNKN